MKRGVIMDIKFIRGLATLMQDYNLNRLNYSQADTKLELEIYGGNGKYNMENILDSQNSIPNIVTSEYNKECNINFGENNIDRQSIIDNLDSGIGPGDDPNIGLIESNMIGTFYSKPSPDDDVFAEVGKVVNKDDVVCIIESMKLMNEIRAPYKCEILEVLVEDGQIIEFGQDLFKVKNLESK